MMAWLDPRFRQHPRRYLAQCGVATLVVLLILTALDVLIGPVAVASLGASTFIVFAMPGGRTARPRALLGGYGEATLCGVCASWAATLFASALPEAALMHSVALCGALAVGASMLLMVATQCEHPPAAGLALSYVVQPWGLDSVLFAECRGLVEPGALGLAPLAGGPAVDTRRRSRRAHGWHIAPVVARDGLFLPRES